MKLCALNEHFEVIHIKPMEQEYEIVQCQADNGNERYTMLHFTNEAYVRELLPPFFALMDNHMYEDYKGCFTNGEDLYLVFYQGEGIPLTELLQENTLSAGQRLQIGKHILEKILLWQIPEFMVCQLLCDMGQIRVTGETVAFDYEWKQKIRLEADMGLVNECMAEFIKRLFQREIEYGIDHRLTELVAYLEEGKPEDVFAVYEAYCNFLDGLKVGEDAYVSRKKRLGQKVSGVVKKGLKIGEMLLVFAAYLAAAGLLVQEIQEGKKEKQEAQGVVFEKIGNLTIR